MTTITHEAAERVAVKAGLTADRAYALFEGTGITITPPAPPEAMVKLAREIAADRYDMLGADVVAPSVRRGEDDEDDLVCVALAALQHAVKVVKDAPRYTESKTGDQYAYLPRILKQLGADA